MRTKKNRLLLLAVTGLIVAVTAIASIATAAPQDGGNSLTIRFCENDEWGEDFSQTTGVTVDLVKVATARPHDGDNGYDYDFAEAGFPGTSLPDLPDEGDWDAAGEAVSKLVSEGTPKVTITDTNEFRDLDDGIYLVLVHDGNHPVAYGNGIADSLLVETERWTYSFAPSLVALPSRAVTDGAFGEWQKDVTATMKPTRATGVGSVRIDKTIEGFDGRPVILAYEIVGRTTDGEVAYRETRSLSVPAGTPGEEHASIVINDVPTGLTIAVDEAYPGADYSLVDTMVPDDPVTARDRQPTFSFRNRHAGTGTTGGGITNRFVYDEDGNKDWTWHADESGKEGQQ